MAAGKPLTPAQVETIARVYAQTGNFSEAGRAAGTDHKAAARVIREAGEPERAQLHARATERGIRKGRKYLKSIQDRVYDVLMQDLKSGAGMEPRDIAALMNALTRTNETLMSIAAHRERTEKIRAETALLKAKAAGEASPENITIVSPGDKAFDEKMIEIFGSRRQGVRDQQAKTTVEMKPSDTHDPDRIADSVAATLKAAKDALSKTKPPPGDDEDE